MVALARWWFFLGCDMGSERYLWDRENLAFCPSSCTCASECCSSTVDIGFSMKFHIWLGLWQTLHLSRGMDKMPHLASPDPRRRLVQHCVLGASVVTRFACHWALRDVVAASSNDGVPATARECCTGWSSVTVRSLTCKNEIKIISVA